MQCRHVAAALGALDAGEARILFKRGRDYDHVLFFQYLYYPTVLGLPLVPERVVLVPTAHEEAAIGLSAYKPVFLAPRAIAYSTEEERRMVWRRFRNHRVPNEVVGVGIEMPADRDAARFRAKHGVDRPYLLYVGRIGVSKGSRELFANYEHWRASDPSHDVALVLPDTGCEGAFAVGERIRERVAAHKFLAGDGLDIHLTVSVGVATLPDVAASSEELMQAADNAMYRVKESGKNGIQAAAAPADN